MTLPPVPPVPATAAVPPVPATAAAQASLRDRAADAAVDLYWLPLGADHFFVRLSGSMYEAVRALLERRRPLALYHCALEVRVPAGRYVIELAPIPDGNGATRGVVGQGPVGSRWLGRFRVFRYELRYWLDGTIPDVASAVASPQRLTDDPRLAHELLAMVTAAPTPVWGRDELHTGAMWNSNSLVSWLIACSGLQSAVAAPPPGGRAPGWEAGLVVARADGDRKQVK